MTNVFLGHAPCRKPLFEAGTDLAPIEFAHTPDGLDSLGFAVDDKANCERCHKKK